MHIIWQVPAMPTDTQCYILQTLIYENAKLQHNVLILDDIQLLCFGYWILFFVYKKAL